MCSLTWASFQVKLWEVCANLSGIIFAHARLLQEQTKRATLNLAVSNIDSFEDFGAVVILRPLRDTPHTTGGSTSDTKNGCLESRYYFGELTMVLDVRLFPGFFGECTKLLAPIPLRNN